VRNNRAFAANAYPGSRHATPNLGVAIVTCMDARIDVFRARGFVYEAHSGQLREVR
jgi:carbonic anhydrase